MRTITVQGPRGLRIRTVVPGRRRERMRGLFGRGSLDPDEGMLLEHTRSIHTFGMRFTISTALLDRDWVVRAVIRMPPGRLLLPRPRVRHVLELPVAIDVRPGDCLRPLTPARSRPAVS